MKTVDQMIDDIIRREGGYVFNKHDKGRHTKYGITLNTLEKWRGKPITMYDVRDLMRTEAVDIYKAVYFARPNINLLPEALQPVVFDMAVNMGPKQAIKILQRACRAEDDGIIGDETLIFADATIDTYGVNRTIARITDERIKFYRGIVKRDPSQVVFLNGWENRAREFLA